MNMDIYGVFFRYFRRRRLAKFRRMFPEDLCRKSIDLGGTRYQWDRLGYDSDITILKLRMPQDMASNPPNYRFVVGDARDTGLPTAAYDLAFSNSVIEHVGDKS